MPKTLRRFSQSYKKTSQRNTGLSSHKNQKKLTSLLSQQAAQAAQPKRSGKSAEDPVFGPAISTYTSKQAVSDGFLFDVDQYKRTLTNLVTTNLMSKGYIEPDGKFNKPNFDDLLFQAQKILGLPKNNEPLAQYYRRIAQEDFKSGNIELPNGTKQKIFVAKNETGRYTIMLPEDY